MTHYPLHKKGGGWGERRVLVGGREERKKLLYFARDTVRGEKKKRTKVAYSKGRKGKKKDRGTVISGP